MESCARHGVPYISVWRHKLADVGAHTAARQIRDAGLRVSSVCRGGMFPAPTAAERAERIEDNRRAIDEAATLGAEVLVLVCGAAPDRDLAAARAMVADGIAAIAPYAAERGVRLGIEPLHPAFAAERSCITTMREARLIAERFDSANVGVVVDVYHVWWDPERARGDRAASATASPGYHVNDWLVPREERADEPRHDGRRRDRAARGFAERSSAPATGTDRGGDLQREHLGAPVDDLVRLTKERFVAMA